MNNSHLIIKNGSLVSSNGIIKKDIYIKNGKIEKIESESIGTSNNRRGMRIHQHDVTTELIR